MGKQLSLTWWQRLGRHLRVYLVGGVAAVLRRVPLVERLVPSGKADGVTRSKGGIPAQRTGSDLFDQQTGVPVTLTSPDITIW